MGAVREREAATGRVRQHRARLRAKGLRPIQLWVPDTRTAEFQQRAHDVSRRISESSGAEADQSLIDEISDYL